MWFERSPRRKDFLLLLFLLALLLVGCTRASANREVRVGATGEAQSTPIRIAEVRARREELQGQRLIVRGVVTSVEKDRATLQAAQAALLLLPAAGVGLGQEVTVTGRVETVEGNLALTGAEVLHVEKRSAPPPVPAALTLAAEQENLYVQAGSGQIDEAHHLRLDDGRWLRLRPLDTEVARRLQPGTRVDDVRGVLRLSLDGWELLPAHPRDVRLAPPRFKPCELQGSGERSPYRGQEIETEGIVTADLRERPAGGLFLQLTDCDENPGTSDALFVITDERLPLAPGDQLRLRGVVEEQYGRTQIRVAPGTLQREARGNPPPPPLSLVAAVNGPPAGQGYEQLEGMLVQLEEGVVVGPTSKHGEFAVVSPGTVQVGAHLLYSDRPAEPILVDDGGQYGPYEVRVGDRVRGLSGVVDFSYGRFKLQLLAPPGIDAGEQAPLPAVPPLSAGEWSLASFNVGNLLEEGTLEGLPLATKLEKLARTLSGPLASPTVIALQEVESLVLLEALAAHPLLAGRYEARLLEGNDPRGIDQALLFESARVELLEAALANSCSPLSSAGGGGRGGCPEGERLLFARPPLVTYLRLDGRRELYLINCHFKSKVGGERKTGPRRLAQARFVASLVNQLRHRSPEAEIIVAGDLNDTLDSLPLLALEEEAPLLNLWGAVSDEERYSYIFNGVAQPLDHILVTGSLQDALIAFHPLRLNADYPYNLQQRADTPLRASDHDPLLAIFR